MRGPRVIAIIEANTVTGPAKNLIRFCRLASSAVDGPLAAQVSIVTYHRSGGGKTPAEPASAFLDAARAAGIEVDVVAERFRFDPGVISQLREILRRRQPDIVQTHGLKSHFLMRWSNLHRQHPWIAFHHGYTFEDLKMRLYNQADRWSLPAAARVVTVCRPFADALVQVGVIPDRIRVLPNSIEPAPRATAEEVSALRADLGIREDEAVILSAGRFSREKAQIDLIHAASHLARLHPDLAFRIVMAGDGPERTRVERAAAADLPRDRTLFPGHVRDLCAYFGLASLFALPSHSEGSPNVILEAMAAGVPIAATAVGGVPETVQNEESALLVPARDPQALAFAMARLLKDQELAIRLARNAALAIERRFSPPTYQRSLVQIYRECLERS